MTWQSSSFSNTAGYEIYQQHWLPEVPVKAQVFIIHGLGEHGGRYQEIAQYLSQRGYRCHALDHQGHGRSEGRRGYIDRFSSFVDTAADFIRRGKAEAPELPSFMIGHSMGGVIASNLLLDHPQLVDGCILSGPALATDDAIGGVQKAVLKLIARLLPTLPVFGLDARLICRDEKVVENYRADPLVLSGKISARLVAEILAGGERALTRAAEISLPMLLLHGEEDALAHPNGSRRMYRGISSTDKEIVLYPALYHEIFNEDRKLEIYHNVVSWLDRHLAGDH